MNTVVCLVMKQTDDYKIETYNKQILQLWPEYDLQYQASFTGKWHELWVELLKLSRNKHLQYITENYVFLLKCNIKFTTPSQTL